MKRSNLRGLLRRIVLGGLIGWLTRTETRIKTTIKHIAKTLDPRD